MGIKSKGNYKIDLCIKFECLNRDIKCKECIKFNEYKPQENNEQ